ncbi:MAG: hypothetical protein HQL38_18775 [Alphaproteobacteria bacterium]|nr:hypothetical protein [Alphaproteobacteria bacterium]
MRKLLIVFVSLGIASCTAKAPAPAYTPTAGTPLAVAVLDAAGLIKRDKGMNPNVADVVRTGGHVGQIVSSAVSPPPGISSGLGIGLSVLSMLTGGSGKEAPMSMAIAWVPRTETTSEEDARERVKKEMLDAFAAGAADAGHVGDVTKTGVFFRDPGCGYMEPDGSRVKGFLCAYHFAVRSVRSGTSPSFLDGEPAWLVIATIWPSREDRKVGKEAVYRDTVVFANAAQRLPQWMFIYGQPGMVSDGKEFISSRIMWQGGGQILAFE